MLTRPVTIAPRGCNPTPGIATIAISQAMSVTRYVEVNIALHVKDTSPATAAPASRGSETPATRAPSATAISTSVATGGRHANSATAIVRLVVTTADVTLVAPPLVARKSESSTRMTATTTMSVRRASGPSALYSQKGARA